MTDPKQKPCLLILTPIGRYQEPLNREALDGLLASGLFDIVYRTVTGVSEVSRARNRLCYLAEKAIQELPTIDAVLWLDSDMVFWPATVMQHYRLLELGLFRAISGAYVNRYDNRLAASNSLTTLGERSVDFNGTTLKLLPVMSGMGCLMVSTQVFMMHLSQCLRSDKAGEIHACYPTLEFQHGENVLVSEDFNYCRSLYGKAHAQVYLCPALQYGHVASKVLVPMLEEKADA